MTQTLDKDTGDQNLPRWQLESLFSRLDGEDFKKAKEELSRELKELEALARDRGIRKQEGLALTLTDETVAAFEALLGRLNRLYESFSDIRVFIYGFVATDSFNNEAQAELSRLEPLTSRMSILDKRFTAWLGSLDIEELIERSEIAREHAFALRQAAIEAKHLMSDAEEELYAALQQTSGNAWARLHGDLSSRGTTSAILPGREAREYTVTELKNLQAEADPALRKAALEAELELIGRHAVAYAAAMNSIKGQVNEIGRRRGWESALDAALFESHISRKSLEAMQAACRESFPVFRRYLKAKARFLGKEKLGWYDLSAPVSVDESRGYGWDEAKAFVVENFRSYSDKLAAFAQHTFDQGWHDVPPRKGKRGGAFCMGASGAKESRVLLNFGGKLDDLFTVAHELGHAYHNACAFATERTPLQDMTPMTLAETASIFCETIVVNAALAEAGERERLSILEQDLLGTTQLVVDIHSRFLFESAVFEKRRERALSIEEFSEIMLSAQSETYGDALETRHPYMWAQKGHYYSAARSFYNFPYTFGYLFGLGLYARYRAEPEGFHARYDELLSKTGMADAASLADEFGIDIESPEFWKDSLKVAEARVSDFEALVEKYR
jgi:oligoendopeptidase F